MRTTRYCRRCGEMVEHYEADPPRLPASLILLYPAIWLFDRFVNPPACLTCMERDRRGSGHGKQCLRFMNSGYSRRY